MAYKLVEYGERPVLKRSPGKVSWPGAKQLFRQRNKQGQLEKDIVGLHAERIAGTETLLSKVMDKGKRVVTLPTLAQSRAGLAQEFGESFRFDKSNPQSGSLSGRVHSSTRPLA